MNLGIIDLAIILGYVILSVVIGVWVSRRASKSINSYFLGDNEMPWYLLGLSNASGMFDISGTMWMVSLLFVYGFKSVYIPWLWPSFNQIFMMVFLSIWLRRSGAMTGAEWIRFRFGSGFGANLAHIVVVIFALMSVLGFLAYGFIGAGKFAATFLPWELSADKATNEIIYGIIITGLTSIYVVKGGMFSVVLTEVVQFFVMTVACIGVGIVAMYNVSPEQLQAVVPDGWHSFGFGWTAGLDWSGTLESANQKIVDDGCSLFSIFFMLMIFKGALQSVAGPAPNYDMQRVLSARTPIEASKMSCLVNVVLLVPRYMLITGMAVLALVYFMDDLQTMESAIAASNAELLAVTPDATPAKLDFDLILPFVLKNFIPVGLLGLLVAGLLAAFMSTFAATVNAAPAYVVNDIYKRYLVPDGSDKSYVYLSYAVSIFFIIAGTAIGLYVTELNNMVQWLVGALYGGYTAANLLKWLWWRFNGFGYFWGMLTGIAGSVVIPYALPEWTALEAFPMLFAFCLAGCFAGTLLTPPEDMEVLKEFYRKTRPWGFWGPVAKELQKEYPGAQPNGEFSRDAINVFVGIIWQTSICAFAILLVTKLWLGLGISVLVFAVTSLFLKFNWFDKLSDFPADVSSQTQR